MSVLIKGITLDDFIRYGGEYAAYLDGTGCTVELPGHGDLIDRDEWKKSLIDEEETIGIDGFSIDGVTADDVCYAIENAPVVIPAERSEE